MNLLCMRCWRLVACEVVSAIPCLRFLQHRDTLYDWAVRICVRKVVYSMRASSEVGIGESLGWGLLYSSGSSSKKSSVIATAGFVF